VIGPSSKAGDDIRGYLLPGERVLWQGKPNIGAYSLRGAWYAIPFSILWGGFAIFWEVSVLASGGPIFFALWGVPFVLIGLYMIFGRILVARREARNTAYAITDQRVLILTGAFRRSFVELDLVNMPGAELSEGRNGAGSIQFGGGGAQLRMPPGWPSMGAYRNPPAFQAIDDVRRVFETLQQTRADLRKAS
jgi:hypothetical protein